MLVGGREGWLVMNMHKKRPALGKSFMWIILYVPIMRQKRLVYLSLASQKSS